MKKLSFIVPLVILLPAILAVLIPLSPALFNTETPSCLLAPPAKAKTILEIETLSTGDTIPIIQTIDGMIYKYDPSVNEDEWITWSQPQKIYSDYCNKPEIQRLNNLGIKLVSCKKNRESEIWYARPVTYYAVDTGGNVWLSRKNLFYPDLSIFLFGFISISGTILIIWGIIGLGKFVLAKRGK